MVKLQKNDINGLLLLNKPKGLTSNQVLGQVKRLFNAKKAGHTGTLDPLASGVLPICFGRTTKFAQYLQNDTKEYLVTCKFGITTDSYDADGNIVNTIAGASLGQADLELAINSFLGEIKQEPPMYSALKHKGRPLYKYAREGITIERALRLVTIYAIELENYAASSLTATIRVLCSKGTYIRSLIHDLGQKVKIGAHVVSLERSMSAGFNLTECHSLEDITHMAANDVTSLNSILLPTVYCVRNLPTLELTLAQLTTLRYGQNLYLADLDLAPGIYAALCDGTFVGVVQFYINTQLKVVRLL